MLTKKNPSTQPKEKPKPTLYSIKSQPQKILPITYSEERYQT